MKIAFVFYIKFHTETAKAVKIKHDLYILYF